MELKYNKVTEMKNGSAGASYNQINWGATIANDLGKSGKKFSSGGNAAVVDGANRIDRAVKRYEMLQGTILKLKEIKGVNNIFEDKIIEIYDSLTVNKKTIGGSNLLKELLIITLVLLFVTSIGVGNIVVGVFVTAGLLGFIVAPFYFLIKPGKVEKKVEALNQKLMPCLELHNKIEYIKDNYKTLIEDDSLSDEQKLNIRNEYIQLSIEESLPNIQRIHISHEKSSPIDISKGKSTTHILKNIKKKFAVKKKWIAVLISLVISFLSVTILSMAIYGLRGTPLLLALLIIAIVVYFIIAPEKSVVAEPQKIID